MDNTPKKISNLTFEPTKTQAEYYILGGIVILILFCILKMCCKGVTLADVYRKLKSCCSRNQKRKKTISNDLNEVIFIKGTDQISSLENFNTNEVIIVDCGDQFLNNENFHNFLNQTGSLKGEKSSSNEKKSSLKSKK